MREIASPPAAADGVLEDGPGVAVAPVAGTRVEHDFKSSYLASPTWKLFADPGSQGLPIVAIVLDGSNEVTSAEMRIGASDDAAAITACAVAPAEATGPASTTPTLVGDVPFTHFSVGDNAMSHYVSAESYRAVRDGKCYAIDLVIAGTRPEVYDPPRTPPFTRGQAQERLAEALKAVHWVE